MPDEIMTAGSEFSSAIPKYWSTTWYDVLLASIVFQESIASDYEGDIKGLGDTVNVTQWPEFDAAIEFGENEAVQADSVTAQQIQLVINKQVAKDFIITKKAQIQGLDAQMKLRDMAFYSVMKKMQKTIIETVVPSASSPDHTVSYASGTTLALADLLGAKELLDTANVPQENRVSIHGAAQWNDIFNISGFTSRDYVPNANAMSSGSIPTPILGFQPKLTTEAGNVSYCFHRSFMQFAVQKQPTVEVFNLGGEGRRATRVNLDVLWGLKQFASDRVVTIS